MADISLVCCQLGCVKEVHVVAAEGECKELLLLLEKGYLGDYRLTVYESGATLEIPAEDPGGLPEWGRPEIGAFLFEPGKALLKAGAFDLPCRYGLEKMDQHTHLYLSREPVPEELRSFGKCYEILEVKPLNKQSFKEISARYSKADVTVRNLPMRSEELRHKLKLAEGGPLHIFGLKAAAGNLLLCTERVFFAPLG